MTSKTVIVIHYCKDIGNGQYYVHVNNGDVSFTCWAEGKPVIETKDCTVGEFAESK